MKPIGTTLLTLSLLNGLLSTACGSAHREDQEPQVEYRQSALWGAWLDRDDPFGDGDWETRALFPAGEVCDFPIGIQCETLDGRDYRTTGQVYTCNTTVGGLCRNEEQLDGQPCLDYRVRFRCGAWTPWLNRDVPSGTGDWELRSHFAPGTVCDHPVAIECQTVHGFDYRLAGDSNYLCDPDVGGVCKTTDQPGERECLNDYRVRFLCP